MSPAAALREGPAAALREGPAAALREGPAAALREGPAAAAGPAARLEPPRVDRPARAAALVGLGFVLALFAAGPDPVDARVVRLEGVPAPGWYEADDLAAAARAAGAAPAALASAPVEDGATVRLVGGWALPDRAPAPLGATTSGSGAAPPPMFGGKVSLNRASNADLEALPGIGPALAARIVAGRPYRSLADLDAVKGIGPAKLARLAPLVTP